MRFQPVNCNMMQVTRKLNKIQASYALEGTVLENVDNIKYHGVTITNDFVCLFCFVWVDALRPSQHFFSHVGTEPPLPGYYKYFLEVNVSCSRIQHGDPSEYKRFEMKYA